MRLTRRALAGIAAAILAVALAAPAGAAPDRGRDVLGDDDGWAAAEGGTTGGAAADDDHVFHVSTWQELRDALGGEDVRDLTTPRIVYIHGEIDANTAPDGTLLTCEDYAVEGYSLEAYLQAYGPDDEPQGELEELREASAEVQEEQIRQNVPSNTTLIGVGDDARLVGANLRIQEVDNVIVRNVRFSDAYDCFPQWDPGDAGGTWNSEYDNIWINGGTHVWIDHNTFDDGDHPPSALPEHNGAVFEVHDGLLDITNAADLVTVSWNVFDEHDKVMLIGSSDSRTTDRGHLRVTLHHNLFRETGQRTPRVRFGQVHVYNNYYIEPNADLHDYNWGVGVESQIYAESNYFDLAADIDPAEIIANWRGTEIEAHDNLVNGRSRHHFVDLVAAHNAANEVELDDTVGWEPTLVAQRHPVQAVPAVVSARAGAGNLH